MNRNDHKVPYRLLFVFAFVYLTISTAYSQVKIGDNSSTINPGALLELESSEKGVIFPRIAINDDLSIWGLEGNVPVSGMVVYNTNKGKEGLYCWYDSKWHLLGEDTEQSESTVEFVSKRRMLLDDGDSTIIASGRVCSGHSEADLLSFINAGTTTEGDIYYLNGSGVYIRNDNDTASTIATAYIFISAIVSQGAILCSSTTLNKSTSIDNFMVAETGLYQKPDTAVVVAVEAPDSSGTFYSFAIPNEWSTPRISLKVANTNNDFFKLQNCWNVKYNVERNGQMYQIWTMDVALKDEVMAKPYEFSIE